MTASVGAALMGIWSLTTTGGAAALQPAASPRDARAARRLADAVLGDRGADHDRDRERRDLRARRPGSSTCGSCSASRSRSTSWLAFAVAVPADDRLDRDARLPPRRGLRPLPSGLGGRQPASSSRSGRSAASSSRSRSCPTGSSRISWALAPTWGMSALRDAALGTSPWADIAMCVALSVVYAAVGLAAAPLLPAAGTS